MLLLCSSLGRTDVQPLSLAQYQKLFRRVQAVGTENQNPDAELTQAELLRLGYEEDEAQRILHLLDGEAELDRYLESAKRRGISVITRISEEYPTILAQKLQALSPAVLFCKGDLSMLNGRFIACVGSRELMPSGQRFAQRVGELAAQEGFCLVSGGAIGADREAERACLSAGGCVMEFPAGSLDAPDAREGVLYVSEGGFDIPFSAQRALSRNRLIHAMGEKTFVAQCTLGKGGTWSGTTENLHRGWSEVFVCEDGSKATEALIARGATAVRDLKSIENLRPNQMSFYE